jgi:hypothetical protein
MTEKRTVEEFIKDLEDYSFEGDSIAVDVNLLLEAVAEALNGKLYTVLVTDKHTEHRKIVIEYGTHRKGKDIL